MVISDGAMVNWAAENLSEIDGGDPSLDGEFFFAHGKPVVSSSSSNALSRMALGEGNVRIRTGSLVSSPEVESRLVVSGGHRGRKRVNIQDIWSINPDAQSKGSLHNLNIINMNRVNSKRF